MEGERTPRLEPAVRVEDVTPVELDFSISKRERDEYVMDYVNEGVAKGIISRSPERMGSGVGSITVAVKDSHLNPILGRENYHFLRFRMYGEKAVSRLVELKKHQIVEVHYKVETKKVDGDGSEERRFFQDLIITELRVGRILSEDEVPFILRGKKKNKKN